MKPKEFLKIAGIEESEDGANSIPINVVLGLLKEYAEQEAQVKDNTTETDDPLMILQKHVIGAGCVDEDDFEEYRKAGAFDANLAAMREHTALCVAKATAEKDKEIELLKCQVTKDDIGVWIKKFAAKEAECQQLRELIRHVEIYFEVKNGNKDYYGMTYDGGDLILKACKNVYNQHNKKER